MLPLLFLLAGSLVPVACAANATLFPVALGPEANLQGEIIGSGGEVGTTYVLSGETRGLAFTLTLAQDSTFVAEKVSIPTLSFDLDVGCIITVGSAICQNVVVSAGATSTLPLTTLPYSPFAVPVSTSGVMAIDTTSSTLATIESSQPSATLSSASGATESSDEIPQSTPAATVSAPSESQSATGHSPRLPAVGMVLVLQLVATLWIIV